MFGNLNSQGTEAVKDNLGGGGFIVETDGYPLTVKALYGGSAASGAMFVQLIATKEDGKEYKETFYVTNKNKENFYTKDNKKYLLPGFIVANDLCLITTGKELSEADLEEKVVKVYDKDANGEVPKNVPMIVEAIGQKFGALIQKSTENKQVKDAAGNYVDTAETRDVNNIEKVFDLESQFTVVEAKQGIEAPEFVAAWLEKNKGKTRDKTKKVAAGGGAAGAPKSSAPPPAAGGAPRPSLFGKK